MQQEKNTPKTGKLVRDKIPEIIREGGQVPIVTTAGEDQYESLLRAKLLEEVGEFLEAGDDEALDELADVLEVICSLNRLKGATLHDLESRRVNRRIARGGFSKRIVWHGNES